MKESEKRIHERTHMQTNPISSENKPLPLNVQGVLHGSSKSSLGHGYLRHYERLFRHLCNEPINIIEIGVYHGESLRMWAEYFPRAVVIGVDSRPECRWHAGERKIVEIGSLDDLQFLQKLAALYRPMIVIDNGSHRADHIMLAFEQLYPMMQHGGLYVAECIHFHGGGGAIHHRGSATTSPPNYFSNLAQLVACPESSLVFNPSLLTCTDTVEFIYGAVVIRRKQAAQTPQDSIATHRPLVEKANHPSMWINFALLVSNNGGDPWEAVAACRKAVELEPADPTSHYFLSIALQRAGDLPGAQEAGSEAVKLDPNFVTFKTHLVGLAS
jgi:tetratricopeptide (TPR) repeat protein